MCVFGVFFDLVFGFLSTHFGRGKSWVPFLNSFLRCLDIFTHWFWEGGTMGTFLGDFFRFGIWISLHTEEGFLRGNGLLVFCFSILSFLEGETVSFFLGGGWWGGGTTCFAFRGLRFWRAKLCPFCAGGGGGTMCFVFIVFRGLGVWTGKLYPFFAGGGGEGRWGWVGELCSVFQV